MTDSFLPKRMIVAVHPRMTRGSDEIDAIVAYLNEKGLDVPKGSLYNEDLRRRVKSGEFDLLIAVGGDGTMLRAGHLCAPSNVPILGINLGQLGFLIQVKRNEWRKMLGRLLAGDFWVEKRMMIRTEHIRAGETQGVWHALNEAVVSRGQYIRPVHLTANVDGQLLTRYVADGLIAATTTGSTAYALTAGGPILPPELRNILLVPIAPHLSVDRAVVLAEGSSVSISIHSENAVLSVDGQMPIGLTEGDRVDVRAGDYTAQFVRFGNPGYFYRNLRVHMNADKREER
jgi:NAD+ kinase